MLTRGQSDRWCGWGSRTAATRRWGPRGSTTPRARPWTRRGEHSPALRLSSNAPNSTAGVHLHGPDGIMKEAPCAHTATVSIYPPCVRFGFTCFIQTHVYTEGHSTYQQQQQQQSQPPPHISTMYIHTLHLPIPRISLRFVSAHSIKHMSIQYIGTIHRMATSLPASISNCSLPLIPCHSSTPLHIFT